MMTRRNVFAGLLTLLAILFSVLDANWRVAVPVLALAGILYAAKRAYLVGALALGLLLLVPVVLRLGSQHWLERDYAALFYAVTAYGIIQIHDLHDEEA